MFMGFLLHLLLRANRWPLLLSTLGGQIGSVRSLRWIWALEHSFSRNNTQQKRIEDWGFGYIPDLQENRKLLFLIGVFLGIWGWFMWLWHLSKDINHSTTCHGILTFSSKPVKYGWSPKQNIRKAGGFLVVCLVFWIIIGLLGVRRGLEIEAYGFVLF